MDSSMHSSLQRSLILGRQVLERASKRRVDWAQIRHAGRGLEPSNSENTEKTPAQRQQSSEELKAVFSSLSGLMIQTCSICQRFHGSLSALSDPEKRHVCRFHCSSERHPDLAPDTQRCEDFHIEVSPGTYSITASDPRSPQQRAPLASPDESPWQQTQLVSLGHGESAVLTFDL